MSGTHPCPPSHQIYEPPPSLLPALKCDGEEPASKVEKKQQEEKEEEEEIAGWMREIKKEKWKKESILIVV